MPSSGRCSSCQSWKTVDKFWIKRGGAFGCRASLARSDFRESLAAGTPELTIARLNARLSCSRECLLQPAAHFFVITKHSHPYTEESGAQGNLNRQFPRVLTFDKHPDSNCLVPYLTPLVTSSICVCFLHSQPNQIEQCLGLGPLTWLQFLLHRHPPALLVCECTEGIILIRPEITFSRPVPAPLAAVTIDASKQEIRPYRFEVSGMVPWNHMLQMEVSRPFTIAAILADPFDERSSCVPVRSKGLAMAIISGWPGATKYRSHGVSGYRYSTAPRCNFRNAAYAGSSMKRSSISSSSFLALTTSR